MPITSNDFAQALRHAEGMSLEELREAAGAGFSRSYYVVHKDELLPLKAIARLAYKLANKTFEGEQSQTLARQLAPDFNIMHLPDLSKEDFERQRQSASRWARDSHFRDAVKQIFKRTCAISGCRVAEVVEAAHILGVGEQGSDDPKNGIALRVDLHRLFDANLLAINPSSGTVHIAAKCKADYAKLEGVTVSLPANGPKLRDFEARWKAFTVDA